LEYRYIIGFIRKQRLNWLGHVERMTEDNNVKKIKKWKPIGKRPTGRPKLRWEDDVLEDIKNMNVCNWKKVAQDRERWKKVVEQARTSNRLWRFIRRRRRYTYIHPFNRFLWLASDRAFHYGLFESNLNNFKFSINRLILLRLILRSC